MGLQLQLRGKTIKNYNTAYEFADEIEVVIPNRSVDYYNQAKSCLRLNAFAMAIKGAKITLGGGYRLINNGEDKPLGEVLIDKA